MPILNIGSKENQNIVLSDLDESISNITSSEVLVANVESLAENITDNIPIISDTIPRIESNVVTTKENISSIVSDIDFVEQKIDRINSDLAESKGYIDNTLDNISYIKNNIMSDLTDKVTDSNTKLNSSNTDINNANNNINSVLEKMGSIEKENQIYNLVLKMKTTKRYGIRINKFEPDPYDRIKYTYDAVDMKPAKMNYNTGKFEYGNWSDIWFIKDNYPCMLKYDGTVDYALDPNDYRKKIDGSNSDISNLSYEGNAMSRFPLIWTQFREDDNYEYITLCEEQYDNTYKPLGFVNDSGIIQDEMFLGMFEGINFYDSASGARTLLRSISGVEPNYEKPNDLYAYAKNNGNGWSLQSWSQISLINTLLTVISKSDDSQLSFGYGNIVTNNIQMTGTLNSYNQFYGTSDNNHSMKVFHIENLYGNCSKLILGLIHNDGEFFYKMNGPFTSVDDLTGYKKNDDLCWNNGSAGYARFSKSGDWGRLPVNINDVFGSSSTFLCDYCHGFTARGISLIANAGCDLDPVLNPFFTIGINSLLATSSSTEINSRLSYIKS